MKRIMVDSLAGRTLATTVALILLAQIFSTALLGAFVLRPQAQRVGSIVAHSVSAVSVAAAAATPEVRAAMIDELDRSEYLDVWRGPGPPKTGGPQPRFLEMAFMQALVDTFGPGSEIVWRTDKQSRLWVQVQIGPELVWLTSQVPSAMQPLSAVIWSGLAAVLLSLLAAVALQRRIAQPLERLTAAVSASDPLTAIPVDPKGAREVSTLTAAFNALRTRLRAVEDERAFMLAGVSHDIRTPLAKLRLAVELLADRDEAMAAAAHRHVEEIDRLLGQFLVFAKGAEAEPLQRFDLDALISEAVALRAADGLDIDTSGEALGEFVGRPEALRRALLNLIDNATRHGAPPIKVVTTPHSTHVSIAVLDCGRGAPEDMLPRLAEPFVHARAGAGSGLGLAIAAQSARSHGGDLDVRNLSGGGFEAEITLPQMV
jgi:two-component system osmolarity sensor histidine kinase EnvZ